MLLLNICTTIPFADLFWKRPRRTRSHSRWFYVRVGPPTEDAQIDRDEEGERRTPRGSEGRRLMGPFSQPHRLPVAHLPARRASPGRFQQKAKQAGPGGRCVSLLSQLGGGGWMAGARARVVNSVTTYVNTAEVEWDGLSVEWAG